MITKYALFLGSFWTLLVLGSFVWFYVQHEFNINDIAKAEARIAFQKDTIYRKWAAKHGGVYVPVTPDTLPNKYLTNPERDISTPSGKSLTLINPAYMTRQVFELAAKEENFVKGHITSLKPIRQENAPDPWEYNVLKSFETGTKEVSEIQVIGGQSYMRLMRPFIAEENCLKCHADQGYKLGDIRGGISVSVPMSVFMSSSDKLVRGAAVAHFMIWGLGIGTLSFGARKLSASSAALFEKNHQLSEEIAERELAQENLEEQALLLEEEISERKKTEEILRESNERFYSAFDNAPTIMAISSIEDGICLDVNQRLVDVFEFTKEEVLGKSFVELGIISELEREKILHSLKTEGCASNLELTYSTKSGKPRIIRYFGQIIPVAGEKRLLSIALDVTEHRKIEQQFFQAQKLESIGRLAGGVAHDFNNMLSIIIGHAELTLMRGDIPVTMRHALDEILDAANRSSEITKQLLMFARKQTIEPKVIDLNDTVSGMLKMLRRLIGEDVELNWIPGNSLSRVKIDPSQLDQILANLCVNSRDAIAGVGKIDIRTDNFKLCQDEVPKGSDLVPGDYVMISVSDNGSGMAEDVIENIFEPFYTTKELGRGTGLGLSTVFGIVKQSGGYIRVFSEPGQGSTFTLYLPGVSIAPDAATNNDHALVGGNESILLVEDEPALMRMAANMLSQLGYTVHTANSPEEAKEQALKYKDEISLLITDMIMPGMNGRDLSDQLCLFIPGLKLLFISGYAPDSIPEQSSTEKSIHVLQKPFTLKKLADKVRSAYGNIKTG